VRLNQQPDRGLRLRLRLSHEGEVLADDAYLIQSQETGRDITLEPGATGMVSSSLLWSPTHPNLLDARVVLEDGNGSVLDSIESYVGVRFVEATDGLFLLNGAPAYLCLVLAQGYWPQSHLAAPSADALRREVAAIKSLGFNGVRIHQKVEDPRFLYWCDVLGLFVWAEMANAYAFTERAIERFTREWLDVVRRDYSHPSIITWVPFNESWGVPDLPGDPAQRDYVRGIYHLTKALDPTRPVIGNDGWEHLVGDVWSIHDYALDGDTLRERYGTPEAVDAMLRGRPEHHRAVLDDTPRDGRPIILSEFGGISYAPQPGTPWFGYGSVGSDDELLRKYEDLVGAVLDCPTISGFCYTQLADTEQEANGLLRADRTPKLDPEKVRAITSRPSKAMPGEAIAAAQQQALATAGGAQQSAEDRPSRPSTDTTDSDTADDGRSAQPAEAVALDRENL
jgi:hypothetical protein